MKKTRSLSKKKIFILIAAAIVLISAAFVFFVLPRLTGGAGGGDEVYVLKVSDITGQTVIVDRFSGVVEAQKTQDYKMASDRKIETVFVKAGQVVEVGTPLFRYDVRETESQIARINLDIEGLYNDIEVLRSAGDSTDIRLQISEKELEIRQRQSDLAGLQNLLSQAEVKSTVAGVVKAVNENGGYDQNGRELPVVSIMETGEFRIKGSISEQSIGIIYQGQEVIVRSRVDESRTWKGVINKIDTEPESQNQDYYYYDGGGERASKYPFYVTIDDTEGLMLGQHVFIEPDYGQSEIREGIWLDEGFIVYDDKGDSYVWASKNGKLEKRYIAVGERDDETFTVQITEGLTEKDLITWPDDTLKAGMKTVDASEGM